MRKALFKLHTHFKQSNLIDSDMQDSYTQFNDFRTGEQFKDFRYDEKSDLDTYRESYYPKLITPDEYHNQFRYEEDGEFKSRYDKLLDIKQDKVYPEEIDPEVIEEFTEEKKEFGNNAQTLKVNFLTDKNHNQ